MTVFVLFCFILNDCSLLGFAQLMMDFNLFMKPLGALSVILSFVANNLT